MKIEDGKEKVEIPKDDVEDPEKAEAARIFGVVLKQVKEDTEYIKLAEKHREMYDHLKIPRIDGDEVDVKRKQISEKPKKVTLAQAKKRRKESE